MRRIEVPLEVEDLPTHARQESTDRIMATPLADLRLQHHPDCVVCSTGCDGGMKLAFALDDGGTAVARFNCSSRFQGYPGMLHGGAISMLLDGAMTNCLFLHGHVAVTADLSIRYRHPVLIGHDAILRARIEELSPPLFRMSAELIQGEINRVSATATFVQWSRTDRCSLMSY